MKVDCLLSLVPNMAVSDARDQCKEIVRLHNSIRDGRKVHTFNGEVHQLKIDKS